MISTRVGAVVIAAILGLACSAAPTKSSFNSKNKDGGADKKDTFGPDQTFGGDGGVAAGPCVPDPGNFEVPGNGCDDDMDGTVDNAESCDNGLEKTGDANAFAKAIGLCKSAADSKWGVVSATYTNGHTKTTPPAAGQHGILTQFGTAVKPREGTALGVISSGWAREFDGETGSATFKAGGAIGPITVGSGAPAGYPKASALCPALTDTHDLINVKLEIKVPANAKGLQFDFNFYSGEWPEFVCSKFNDSFIAYLSGKAFNGGAPENISFDAMNNPVSVNNGFFDRCTAGTQTGCEGNGAKTTAACPGGTAELAGTGFDAPGTYCTTPSSGGGATGWLTSSAPVEPGETITLEFMIWDTGDSALDSSVLIDHFRWVPGAVVAGTQRPPN